MNRIACASLLVVAAACGGSPPAPQVDEPPPAAVSRRSGGPVPQVSQELGSIDERAVQQTFARLEGQLETCHASGRERLDLLAGDVKAFLRIDASGRVRYGYLEESTIGDRETEKCILDTFGRASWPKPQGGEAEVRHAFGWGPGGERAPVSWGPEKVTSTLDDAKDVKKDLARCKAGAKGDLSLTAYVVHDESAEEPAPKKAGAKQGKHDKKHGAQAAKPERGGKFLAIGAAAPTKDVAEKIDCVIDALKELPLPSPGSYPAKVTFLL